LSYAVVIYSLATGDALAKNRQSREACSLTRKGRASPRKGKPRGFRISGQPERRLMWRNRQRVCIDPHRTTDRPPYTWARAEAACLRGTAQDGGAMG